jgi:hypothetical protein
MNFHGDGEWVLRERLALGGTSVEEYRSETLALDEEYDEECRREMSRRWPERGEG